MVAYTDTEDPTVEHFRIEHDKIAKIGLKNKERFIALLKFKLSPEKFHALDFSRFKFIDTELLQKKLGVKVKIGRADIIAEIGVKGTEHNDILVSVSVEHKSSFLSQKELYFQIFKYHEALLRLGIYPIITVVVAHCRKPINVAPDLQTLFGWTPQMTCCLIINCYPGIYDKS